MAGAMLRRILRAVIKQWERKAMAGSPEKRARRERWERLKADPDFLDNICAAVASGLSLIRICAEYDVAYGTVDAWLRGQDEAGQQKYARARESRAQYFVNQLEEITRDVSDEDGIDPKRAKVAGDNLKWLAARHDPHLWGEKSQVTYNHQGSVQLHLQAVRELQQQATTGTTYQHQQDAIEHQPDDEPDGWELL